MRVGVVPEPRRRPRRGPAERPVARIRENPRHDPPVDHEPCRRGPAAADRPDTRYTPRTPASRHGAAGVAAVPRAAAEPDLRRRRTRAARLRVSLGGTARAGAGPAGRAGA